MTDTEKLDKAMGLTAELWNIIVSIENKHPMDEKETCTDIHNIQNRILSIAYRGNLKLKTKLR